MMYYLSHPILSHIPVYGRGKRKIELKNVKSISKGDSSQVFWFGMENHWGTHIDGPAHFFPGGRRISDYPASFWFFRNPQVVSVKAAPGQVISFSDLGADILRSTDLLLLSSGWSKLRGRSEYSLNSPAIDPSLALRLREKYPLLRAVGLDWISVSSFKNRSLGREAHRAFLNPKGKGHPLLLIEDMYIPRKIKRLKQVWVLPLRISGIDSSPCTVIGY